jgi:hypothetical protein
MNKFVVSLCLVVGIVLIIGVGFVNAGKSLPGDFVVSDDILAVVAGAYGPCKNNGKCTGNRPASMVCIPSSDAGGTCTAESAGAACGSCTGTTENHVCADAEVGTSCSTSIQSGCCNVQSSCRSVAVDDTGGNNCSCSGSGGSAAIGSYVTCVSQ